MSEYSPPSNVAHVAAVNSPNVTDVTGNSNIDSPETSNYTSNTTIGSMNELKEKAPKVYNAMIMGIAQNICSEMQHAQTRLKQIMREANAY